MIIQEFCLPRIRWRVRVYYAVTGYYVNEIMADLRGIGCHGDDLISAYRQLRDCSLDTGLTYTNGARRSSVMVIAKTSSAEEFNNSLQHEQRHLERHIANYLDIDPNSEDAAYLAGDIAAAMFSHAKHFMCECCRKKLNHRLNE